jgi:hypothetical protein
MSVQVAVITQAGDRGEWVLARPSLDSINDKLPAEADNNHITKSRSTYRITWERPIALEGEKVILYRDEMIPNRAYPVSVGKKRYFLMKDDVGAIDIYELVK